ncbi:MAG: hypothetical protein ACX93T_00670 [Bacteroidota bacterium]
MVEEAAVPIPMRLQETWFSKKTSKRWEVKVGHEPAVLHDSRYCWAFEVKEAQRLGTALEARRTQKTDRVHALGSLIVWGDDVLPQKMLPNYFSKAPRRSIREAVSGV